MQLDNFHLSFSETEMVTDYFQCTENQVWIKKKIKISDLEPICFRLRKKNYGKVEYMTAIDHL